MYAFLVFSIWESKGAKQVCGNKAADQCLKILHSFYFLNLRFQASSTSFVAAQPGCVRPGWKPRRQVLS